MSCFFIRWYVLLIRTVCFSKSKSDRVRASSSFPDSGPIKHLKGIIGSGLVHHCFGKFQILFLCPEFHFLWNLFSYTSCLSCRIAGQIIIIYRMIENCRKLCLNRFQIIHGIGLALSSRYAIISFCQAITSATVISLIFRFPK